MVRHRVANLLCHLVKTSFLKNSQDSLFHLTRRIQICRSKSHQKLILFSREKASENRSPSKLENKCFRGAGSGIRELKKHDIRKSST